MIHVILLFIITWCARLACCASGILSLTEAQKLLTYLTHHVGLFAWVKLTVPVDVVMAVDVATAVTVEDAALGRVVSGTSLLPVEMSRPNFVSDSHSPISSPKLDRCECTSAAIWTARLVITGPESRDSTWPSRSGISRNLDTPFSSDVDGCDAFVPGWAMDGVVIWQVVVVFTVLPCEVSVQNSEFEANYVVRNGR